MSQRRFMVWLLLACFFISTLSFSSFSSLNHSQFISFNQHSHFQVFSPHLLENASFSCHLENNNIIRGQDDLIIYFQFSFENGSHIPDSTIYYNITNPFGDFVFQRTLIVNTSDTFTEIVSWPNFNNQPEGNYTLFALANSTFTSSYSLKLQFTLTILSTGFLRMFFPLNPVYLTRNVPNKVYFTMSNAGGSTVSNITISLAIEVQGTEGNLIIPDIPSFEGLNLTSGASYSDTLEIVPDTFLYKKIKFSLSYNTIDKNSTIFTFSDNLEVIVSPNLVIQVNPFAPNVTLDQDYSIVFNVTNYEDRVVYIAPHAQCDIIDFQDYDDLGAIIVSPLWHQFSITGSPIGTGQSVIWFWINIEWRDGSQVIYQSTILETIIVSISVYRSPTRITYYSYDVISAIILFSMFVGIMYFSRELVKGLVKKVRQSYPKTIPEITYARDTVILDGSNIAWEEKSIDGKPKIGNIEAMINKVSQANFTKIICVADAALRYQIDDQKRLDTLVREGAIKMLPARVDGDKFILRLAEEENAMIVTNDLFKEYRDIAPWIDERRIPYTILNGEVYLHPVSSGKQFNLAKEKQFANKKQPDSS